MFKYALLLSALFGAAGVAADKHINWETGVVVSQDINSQNVGTYAAPLGSGAVAVPIYRSSNNVTVETADAIYRWAEIGDNGVLIMPVHAEVQFYRDKGSFIVLDHQKKKHRFGLMGLSSKRVIPPSK